MLQLENFEKSRKRRLVRIQRLPDTKITRIDLMQENVVTEEAASEESAFDHDRDQAAEALLMFQKFA